MSYVLLLCLVQFFCVCDIVVFVCFMICVVLFRGRPIIGADIKHYSRLSISAIFKTDLPIIIIVFNFFYYANKHTIYR